MATSAPGAQLQFFPAPPAQSRLFYQVWLPVFCGLTVICCESTPVMGGNTTGRWLADIWPRILGQANTPFFGEVHHLLRKIGHFIAYGTLGLVLLKAWHRSVRLYMKIVGTQLIVAASALAVSCTFLVGSLDEWHQKFMPGRTSTCTDVLIDTGGALLFTTIFWINRYLRRRALLQHSVEMPRSSRRLRPASRTLAA